MQPTDIDANVGLRIARLLLGAIVAAGLGYLAFMLLFFGLIAATGCFLDCSEPNLVVGIPLLAGAVGTAAAGVTALAWGIVGGPLRRLWPVFWIGVILGAGILTVGSLV